MVNHRVTVADILVHAYCMPSLPSSSFQNACPAICRVNRVGAHMRSRLQSWKYPVLLGVAFRSALIQLLEYQLPTFSAGTVIP